MRGPIEVVRPKTDAAWLHSASQQVPIAVVGRHPSWVSGPLRLPLRRLDVLPAGGSANVILHK